MIVTPSGNIVAAASLLAFPAPTIDVTRQSATTRSGSSMRFSFPRGLFGFPDPLSFELMATGRDGVYWLHEGSISFLVVDPFVFFPGCVVDVPDDVLAAIGAEAPSDVLLLAIATLARDPGPTANLQGPLALNPRLGMARQFVVSDPAAEIRAPLADPRAAS